MLHFKKMTSLIGIASKVLAYTFLLLLIIYNCFLIVQKQFYPDKNFNIFGFKIYIVVSGSMEPELNIGDVVIVKKTEKNNIMKDDIISYNENGSIITHRIVEIKKAGNDTLYVTKGDSNNVNDNYEVNYENIEGKLLVRIPKIGNIILSLKKQRLVLVLIIIICLYFSILQFIPNNKFSKG